MSKPIIAKGKSAERQGTERWALAGLSLSMLMPSLDTSIANAGLPALATAFHASFQDVQWIVLTYLLAIATLIVSAGSLADVMGRRRLMLTGIVVFTAASLLCAMAPSLWMLLVARTAQGLGAALMMALAVAFVGETVPKAKAGSAMGLLGTMSAIGTSAGPSLGGLVIAGLGWRAIFLINVPLGLLTLVLSYCYLPADRPTARTQQSGFDYLGTLALTLTLASYALAMTLGRGHFGLNNILMVFAAVVGAGLFVLIEMNTASPLIRLAMFRDPALRASLLMSTLVSTVMMATLVVGPFYLVRALGLAAVSVGFVLSTGPLVSALTGIPAGRIVDRFGTSRTIIVGLVGIAGGALVLATLPVSFGVLGYIAPLVVMTSGHALFQAANNTAIMADSHADKRGVMGGMLGLSRNLGLISGASAMGALFAIGSASPDVTTAPPAAIAAGMQFTFAVAAILIIVALALAVRSRSLITRQSPINAVHP